MSRVPPRLPSAVAETVEAFVRGVRDRFGGRVRALRLFGSYARGEARSDSDVDVLVLLDRVDRADDIAVTDMAADLIWELHGVVVSPLVMSEDDFERWRALERRAPLEIDRDGVAL